MTQDVGDVVERLREMLSPNGTPACVAEAADEIERLRSALTNLLFQTETVMRSDGWTDYQIAENINVKRARTALTQARGDGE